MNCLFDLVGTVEHEDFVMMIKSAAIPIKAERILARLPTPSFGYL
jgi:hypothetical protein